MAWWAPGGGHEPVLIRFRGVVWGAVEAVWTPDGSFLGTLEAVFGHVEAFRDPPLYETYASLHPLVSFRPPPCAQFVCGHRYRCFQLNIEVIFGEGLMPCGNDHHSGVGLSLLCPTTQCSWSAQRQRVLNPFFF